MYYNKVILVGNLTRDPESRFLNSGTQVCKMGLAVNHRYTSQGEKREEVLFIDIEAWGKTAELAGQYLHKGSEILVEGRLKMDKFTTKEGENRTKFVVVADSIQFGSRGQGGEGGGGGYQRQQSGYQQQPAPRQQAAPAASAPRHEYADNSPSYDDGGDFPSDQGTTDDLPF